ncbi:MAG: hypothetical protein MH825_05580 [Cyanobacteria bacterium]|nr:hypothetical protein [Cyanobacteriota bacterium]
MGRQSRRKALERHIRNVFLNDEMFSIEAFLEILEAEIDELSESKWIDEEDYIFAVAELRGRLGMVLIDQADEVYANEDARAMLKKLWPAAYEKNIIRLIPNMVEDLIGGDRFTMGVTVNDDRLRREVIPRLP